ncbi:hypothetical protein PHMEG_00029000 [Phytophthora megakarya]|uniref:Uncharacterized protein n=1 Tax=Phytophthora megakarya TaxID=4795 RepID=A0A225V680_9STRA|nr:hypothetical protein PHMEG_00029000 [Phytophthora megakarya]
MDYLEYVLKQQEDDWDDDRQGSSSTKARDFRADNLRQGRLRTKYPGRAYVTQSGDESDSDERHLTQHVLKVMENSGWNKRGHMAHQGKARQSNGHPGSPSP